VRRSTHRNVVTDKSNSDLGYFSDPPLLVLASLADGPKHGHAMIEDIVRLCGTRLGPGTLYGAITRLEQDGLIESLPTEQRRYPYRITSKGVQLLHAKLTTLRRLAHAGLKRLEVQ
jgi:DNA-binding PadR family transcriptional regulator